MESINFKLQALITICCLAAIALGATDAELLLAFKATFENADSKLGSWKGDNPCDGWHGITCDRDGRVAEM